MDFFSTYVMLTRDRWINMAAKQKITTEWSDVNNKAAKCDKGFSQVEMFCYVARRAWITLSTQLCRVNNSHRANVFLNDGTLYGFMIYHLWWRIGIFSWKYFWMIFGEIFVLPLDHILNCWCQKVSYGNCLTLVFGTIMFPKHAK